MRVVEVPTKELRVGDVFLYGNKTCKVVGVYADAHYSVEVEYTDSYGTLRSVNARVMPQARVVIL